MLLSKSTWLARESAEMDFYVNNLSNKLFEANSYDSRCLYLLPFLNIVI